MLYSPIESNSNVLVVVAVTVPVQASSAVGYSVTTREQLSLIGLKVGGIGACVSSIVTDCVAVLKFPFPSSKRQVMEYSPKLVNSRLSEVVPERVPAQLSSATGI